MVRSGNYLFVRTQLSVPCRYYESQPCLIMKKFLWKVYVRILKGGSVSRKTEEMMGISLGPRRFSSGTLRTQTRVPDSGRTGTW